MAQKESWRNGVIAGGGSNGGVSKRENIGVINGIKWPENAPAESFGGNISWQCEM